MAAIMALKDVANALKNLQKDTSVECEGPIQSQIRNKQSFFAEDSFNSKDVTVRVHGTLVRFPLNEKTINELISSSSKAKFGYRSETLVDMSVRDTQMIPASKLNVKFNNEAMTDVLDRIRSGLGLGNSCTLVPHLFNMLIYGKGQFFRSHRDTEKVENMVATLVIVLPSLYDGGELVISHGGEEHIFKGSQDLDITKCAVFYSDCRHEVQTVTKGFRVTLTYNIELKSPPYYVMNDIDIIEVNDELSNSVREYFDKTVEPKRLVYFLNHSYTEYGLKWHMLKGTDRIHAQALLAVAKKQGHIPCLGLVQSNAHYEKDYPEPKLTKSSPIELTYIIDEQNYKFEHLPNFSLTVSDSESCYTISTSDIEPYKKQDTDWYGNEAEGENRWYRRGCVLLLSPTSKCGSG